MGGLSDNEIFAMYCDDGLIVMANVWLFVSYTKLSSLPWLARMVGFVGE